MKKLTCLITLFLFISVGYINAETMASRKKIKMKVETQHHQRSLPPPCPAEDGIRVGIPSLVGSVMCIRASP